MKPKVETFEEEVPEPEFRPDYAYVAAGGVVPVPADLLQITADVPKRNEIIGDAVYAIWKYVKLGESVRCPPGASAADVVADALGIPRNETMKDEPPGRRRLYLAMLSLALRTAQQSTRYWGVEDPTKESYCSTCRGPVPIGIMSEDGVHCNACFPAAERRRNASA